MQDVLMGENWEALGRAVRDAREARGGTQAWLSSEADVSRATIQKLERGEPVRPGTLSKVEKVIKWAPGSSRGILDGAASPIEMKGTRTTGGLAKIPDGELDQAITNAMVATVDNMTAAEIREVARKAVEELRRLGHV